MHHHIFLSYSRRDLKYMQRVRDDLRAAGLIVWTDEGIAPGSISWKEAIEQAIRYTGVVVVLLSPSANDSRWVQREIDYAEVQGKPILPLLIRGEPRQAVPFALAGSQYVDLRQNYDAGLRAFLKRCWQHLPIYNMKTLTAAPAGTTYMNRHTRRRREIQFMGRSALLVACLCLAMLVGITWWMTAHMPDEVATTATNPDTARDTLIAQATPVPTHATLPQGLLLLYTYDTVVVYNNSDATRSLQNMRFVSEASEFAAREWVTEMLPAGQCLQVWHNRYTYISLDTPPADVCDRRAAYRATVNTFWQSALPNATFSIYQEDTLLLTCPAAQPDSLVVHHCH